MPLTQGTPLAVDTNNVTLDHGLMQSGNTYEHTTGTQHRLARAPGALL